MALTLNQTGLSETLTRLIFMPVFVITYRMPNGKLVTCTVPAYVTCTGS